MLELLRNNYNKKNIWLTDEFRKDTKWWQNYLTTFDGVGIMWMNHVKQPDEVATSDACLMGMGAVSGKEYLKLEFPKEWKHKNIASLELLAVIVMVKQWIGKFIGKSVLFNVDNQAIVQVLNSGRVRDPELLMLMRELVYVAVGKFEFKALHIGSKQNKLPDLLSRWHEGNRVQMEFGKLTEGKGFKEVKITQDLWNMWHTW